MSSVFPFRVPVIWSKANTFSSDAAIVERLDAHRALGLVSKLTKKPKDGLRASPARRACQFASAVKSPFSASISRFANAFAGLRRRSSGTVLLADPIIVARAVA